MDMMLLATSTLCKNLHFMEFGTVGQCFVETTMFGDVVLAGILIFILIVALMLRNNFPIQTILPVGISLTYILWVLTASDLFMGLFILSIIVGGAVMIIGLLQYLNR